MKTDPNQQAYVFVCPLHVKSNAIATKFLQSCNEVATKLDPLGIPCASPPYPHPSIRESTEGGGTKCCLLMDGCGEPGEAQGILDGPKFEATSLQLLTDFVATLSDLAYKAQSKTPFHSPGLGPERVRSWTFGKGAQATQHQQLFQHFLFLHLP